MGDLGVHNVQGINVWANTAPRGWSTSYQRTKATPPKTNPPTVSVCPATPSVDNELMQQRMQETKIAEQEEQIRIQQQQQEQIKIQEEQIRMQQQQEEQMMIQRQQEKQMRIQQQQEEQMRIKQQQEEQLKIQQQEEQLRIQQQQEEQMRIQQQQEEQARIQRQQEEQMRIQQQQEEQRRIQMMMQQQSMTQTSSSSTTTKSGGFAVESRPEPVIPESQLAQPPMSNSSLFESSQSQSFAQQSSSVQQSSSSFSQSQSSKEVYESQQFSGGVMKGYTLKQDQASEQRETGEKMLNSGVFGGIGADNNSLVDSEVDYKKHTVKDLAKHFALVKPKADIPHAILPEQRIYNGDQGPALNYLGASAQGSTSSTQSFMKKEISQEDFEASKKAYEAKKKQQQMEAQQSQSSSSQSTVVKRTETSTSSEQKSMLNERRQSLTTSLMLDPAAAHAESGIIDPSAILRGSDASGIRSRSEGLFGQTTEAGETDKILNKWDNHNAIARGWGGVKENYHPVTFRGIYNVDSQKNFTTQNL